MRRMIALLLLALASHSAQAVEAGNQLLAVSQGACEHCQVVLTADLPGDQMLVPPAGVELAMLPATPVVRSVHRWQAIAVIATPMVPTYAAKVRRHLQLCVMRD